MTTTMTAPVHNRYYCKYDYKYNVRSRWQTLLIDDYLLGLMWCLGTLAKDRPFFCFHTYEEDKKYYIDNYIDIIDNDKGAIKLVKFFDDDSPYISLKGHDYATLYEGEPVISNYWYVWMK